jgi:hypothetical protein
MRALRSAAALLRGAAGLAQAPQRVLAAGGDAQAAAELARRLDQGCAARQASTAVGDEPGAPLRGAAADVSVAPRRRAPNVGVRGEKTADGRPKPDERTVEDLVRRGWFKTEEAVMALLTRAQTREHRFPYETAKPAADWLEARLGFVPLKGGMLPAAKAVKAFPDLLLCDAATLQRKWDALTLSAEQGGVGIAFLEEQAREAVVKLPQVLGYATDTLQRGWSMLTATEGGLGLSPDEARRLILLSPNVLLYEHDAVVRRVELLKSLGYPEAHEMVLKASTVLNFKAETVREHDAWWKQTGLDHVKIITMNPTLLGVAPVEALQEKLNFLRDVSWLSTDDLNNGGPFFQASLDNKLRPRFFYAWKHGALERYKLSSLSFCSDAVYLRKVHRLGAPASEDAVKRYKEVVASADFQAWAAQEEAQRRRDATARR